MKIMDGIQLSTEHFVALIEMMQVSSAVILTGITFADLIQRACECFIVAITEFYNPFASKKVTITSVSVLPDLVGITQSNISTPRLTASTISAGLPTPIK